jgi:hypothetical protein
LTEPPPDLVVAIGEVASAYGLRLSIGDHAAIARRLADKDRAALTRKDVTDAFAGLGIRPPAGFAQDVVARWSALVPPKALLDILLEYRLDAIDALSAEFGGKKKPEETLRNNLRMYLKGRHHVESRTGKGFTDILIPSRRAIIEAKVWTSRQKYEDGLVELAEYIRTERPPTEEGFFVLFCDDDPLPAVVPSRDLGLIDTRRLSGLSVPVVAVQFQVTAPSKKAYAVRRSPSGR